MRTRVTDWTSPLRIRCTFFSLAPGSGVGKSKPEKNKWHKAATLYKAEYGGHYEHKRGVLKVDVS